MKRFKLEGIVIRRRNSGEADRFVTLFAKDYGKINLKASGVRKISSRRSAHIELLNSVEVTIHKGNGIGIITEAQTIEAFENIKTNLRKVGFSYHMCELIDGLCAEGQEHDQIYELLYQSLTKLDKAQSSSDLLSEFERNLLHLLGYLPQNHEQQTFNTSSYIEQLLERKLKSKGLIPRFLQ
ncbi:MAG TPA: DNA repair protein RecO [Candidatus Saccharimonadales bacterium]|nr:DNA repair protein RecO [Candidatus Saccharimonadales bacterium]